MSIFKRKNKFQKLTSRAYKQAEDQPLVALAAMGGIVTVLDLLVKVSVKGYSVVAKKGGELVNGFKDKYEEMSHPE